MITLNLTPIFQARNIERPFSFLVKAGFSRESAHKFMNNSYSGIRFEHIEKLCLILVCEPSDLFLFTPKKDQHYPANTPLLKLVKQPSTEEWGQALATTPFKELKELTNAIINTSRGKQ